MKRTGVAKGDYNLLKSNRKSPISSFPKDTEAAAQLK